jgi:hypothetical protein
MWLPALFTQTFMSARLCRGVAFGDSWISPTDFLAAWGPYLNAMSLLDGQPLSNTATFAANAQVHTTCSVPIVYDHDFALTWTTTVYDHDFALNLDDKS